MEYQEEIEGLELNYKRTGAGLPIILLHGWGCDLNIFERIQNTLEKNFLVYSIDLPGFGKSTPPKEVWGIEEYTRLVETFIKKKNIQKPILMGHSFGGRISILYASRNETDKIILVDSAGIKPKRSMEYYFKVYSYKLMKRVVQFLFSEEKAKAIIESKQKKAGSSDYQNALGIMKNILSKVVNEDLKHVMPKIKASTLLIWGENDTATPVSDAKTMEKLIPDSGLVVLKGVGHYSFIEKMGEFQIIVNSFLGNKN